MAEITMILFALLIFCVSSTVLGHAPCVDYSDVCVPAQAMQQGCRCALIRPGQQQSAAITFKHMLSLTRSKRDTFEDIKFAILGQPGVDELNRFFTPEESVPAGVDNNVFASVNTQVHASLMTVPKGLVAEVVNLLADYLSDEARNQLLNCGGPRCEVVGQTVDLMGDVPPTQQNRQFRVARAVRYDIDGEDTTLIAFSSAVSDFVLNKVLVQWEEKKCKRRWFKKKCWNEPRSREDLRVFDEGTKNNWMNHVNREMVGKFRVDNANLLISTLVKNKASNLVSTRKTEINDLSIIAKGGYTSLSFTVSKRRDFALWMLCISHALKYMKIVKASTSTETDSCYNIVLISLETEEVNKLLDYLKPIIYRTNFVEVNMWKVNDQENIEVFLQFFEGKALNCLLLQYCEEFPELLESLQKVKVDHFVLTELDIANMAFFLQLADMAKSITVFTKSIHNLETLTLIREVLLRKCEDFYIDHYIENNNDIEKLIQFFHHIEKRIHFIAWRNAPVIGLKIGEYEVTKDIMLTIKHAESEWKDD